MDKFPRKREQVPVAGAGEVVDSVDAGAAVEAGGRIETVVGVVGAPGAAESRRAVAQGLAARPLPARAPVETGRLVGAPGQRLRRPFAERAAKVRRAEARGAVAARVLATRSAVEAREFRAQAQRAQVVLAAVAGVAQRAAALEPLVVGRRRAALAGIAARPSPARIRNRRVPANCPADKLKSFR